jgi:hypothetical protein
MATASTTKEPRRWWLAYSGEEFLGRVGADNSGRAIAKAAKEYGLPPKAITVKSEKTGEEPKAAATVIVPAGSGRSYEELNAVVRAGLDTFREVGTALLEIQEAEKFLDGGYSSFACYLKAECGMSKSSGYRLMDAARVANRIADDSGNRPNLGTVLQPTSESQVRSLKTVPADQQAEAWSAAVAESDGHQPTAAKVAEVAERFGGHSLVNGRTLVNGREASGDDAAKLRANGRIPHGVDVEITDPGDDATDVAAIREEHAERKAITEAELSDSAWLATLPLATVLEGVSLDTFRRDALAYREIDALLEEYRLKAKLRGITKAANPAGKMSGAYASAVGRLLRHQHPRDWKVCPPIDKGGCNGTGMLISGQCNTCRGRGYNCQ